MVESTAQSASDKQTDGERPSGGGPASGGARTSTPSPPPQRKRSIGARVGLAVYWALIAFVIGFGVRSITLQVFWPHADAPPPAQTCRAGIGELASELRARGGAAAAEIRQPTRDDRFFSTWETRYRALGPLCQGDTARDAYGTLARYRYSLEQSLVRHQREGSELSRDLDARLAALRP